MGAKQTKENIIDIESQEIHNIKQKKIYENLNNNIDIIVKSKLNKHNIIYT